jgi:multidrug resistance efflux pump
MVISGGAEMSTFLVRAGVLACASALAAGPAQDRRAGGAAGRDGVKVFNQVEGAATVVACVPDGSAVKKGDTVCEFDPSGLTDRLAVQETVIRGAEADHRGAGLARKAAELDLDTYVKGTYRQDVETIMGEITLAEANRKRVEDRLEWSNRMLEKGYVSLAENTADKLALKHATFNLEQAQTKVKVLQDHAKDATIARLRGKVEKAKARELAKEAALAREVAVRKRLEAQLGHCKVTAPEGGRVRYNGVIGVGARVADGQWLFTVVPDGAPPGAGSN